MAYTRVLHVIPVEHPRSRRLAATLTTAGGVAVFAPPPHPRGRRSHRSLPRPVRGHPAAGPERQCHPEAQAHKGSAFQYGWWGYVDKDLHAVLGEPVQGGLGRTYRGGGSLAACRQMLLDTLRAAAARPALTSASP
jgi:hypothetical protein